MTGITAGQLSEAIRAATVDGISTLYIVKPGSVRYVTDLTAAIQPPMHYERARGVLRYGTDPVAYIKVCPFTSDIMPWQAWPGRIVIDHAVRVHGALAMYVKAAQQRYPVLAEAR